MHAGGRRRAVTAARQIGQYELRSALGTGGMGVVYEAFHPRLEKRVAIKILHPRLAEDSTLVERFLDEGRAAARIRHPHVVDITDVGSIDGVPYLVMELLEGETLADKIARDAPLGESALVDIVLPICSALEAAHEMGVLHRDLKPENVFLARIGTQSAAHPKIVDFGIAKVRDAKARVYATSRSVLVGTPYYMPVEQARDSSTVDERADQYSLGVIAYECLTGRRPFEGEGTVQVLGAVAAGHFTRPRALVPSLSPELESVVLRAMARDREHRFPSMRELAIALMPHASGKARFHWAPAFGQASIAPPANDSSAAFRWAPQRSGPARILVIEDEESIRENLVELLELEGYAAPWADSGERGLALARAEPIDLVLCDVTLPGLSGHDLLRALRADAATADLPFVFLTGLAEPGHVRAGMKLGADDYLTKPFARDDLLDAVRTRLARVAARESAVPPLPKMPVAHAPTLLLDSGETRALPVEPPKR